MRIYKTFIITVAIMLFASACSGKPESGRKQQESSKYITNKKAKGEKTMKTVEMTSEMFKSKS